MYDILFLVMRVDYSAKIINVKELFHLNDAQLADILKVSIHELRDWQNGIKTPSKENIKLLYNVFGITSDMLFNDKKRCNVRTMKIKLDKNFQLMDAIYSYYSQWRVCALTKRNDLYIFNPILSFLYFIIYPFEAIGDAIEETTVDSIKGKRNYIDYVDYLLEHNCNFILVYYKKKCAFIHLLRKVPLRRRFKFKGKIYKKIGYMS